MSRSRFSALRRTIAALVPLTTVPSLRLFELLLSCDCRQGYHMTSEGEALRPEEECAKHSKASH